MRAAPGEAYPQLSRDGAWCFFADPRALSYQGNHARTYVGWLTGQGDVMAGSIDHPSGQVEAVTIRQGLQVDDHANPALSITGTGHLIVYYSAHCGDHLFYQLSKRPEDISEWEAVCRVGTNTEGDHGYTYPYPVRLNRENRHFLFWRGGNFKPTFSTSVDARGWQPARTLIAGEGDRPYIKYATNGTDKIVFAFTDGHPNQEVHNNVYCACYEQGVIYQMDGSRIKALAGLPLRPDEAGMVYDATLMGASAWVWDVALDDHDHPVIVYAVFMADHDHRYRYACWNGKAWEDHEITQAGTWFPQTPPGATETEPYYSGGIALDRHDPRTVYLSREVKGVFEIERWITPDRGRSWHCRPVTAGSRYNNVRPCLPRGTGRPEYLFWMSGHYTHYTKYQTSIRMKPLYP